MASTLHRARRSAHPLPVRLRHWIGVYAMARMILSGLVIYNASPLLPLDFRGP